jgi:hydrogenase nickel incorporation protein HypA/HybF
MHELPVAEATLETALEAARGVGGRRILAVDLVVGELSTFVDDSIQFYFDLLSTGTLAEGAALRFCRVPGRAECADCGHGYDARPPLDPVCPVCAGCRVRVHGGQDLLIESVEVSDEDPAGDQDPQGQ